jgi:endogenous inhibitor of DNA gyrase (YacG/DUF329 family)
MKFSSGIVPGSKNRRVMIKCPNSGAPVDTGVAMDEEAFATVSLNYELQCPSCSSVHRWTKSDSFLEPSS